MAYSLNQMQFCLSTGPVTRDAWMDELFIQVNNNSKQSQELVMSLYNCGTNRLEDRRSIKVPANCSLKEVFSITRIDSFLVDLTFPFRLSEEVSVFVTVPRNLGLT